MILLALAAAAASAAVAVPDAGCAANAFAPGHQRFAEVQGVTLAYVRCGQGAPTVVFEGGFGGNLRNWSVLAPKIGGFAPIFAYSRPGFGDSGATWSADADGLRTSTETARLLRDLLRAARVPPPYVLVGHSLGGLYIQKFAQLFPKDTAGLVLMDNRPATLMKQCAADGLPDCLNNAAQPDWSPVLRVTFLGIEPSEASAPTPEALGGLPALVISAGRPEPGLDPRFFEVFEQAQTDFAARLKAGRHVTIADATHSSLSGAQADAVAREIRAFWDGLVRRRRVGRGRG